jgi:tetratricopeptide (TPR) repeat protein
VYELYLRGRYFWNKRTEEGMKKGLRYFQQAIEKDPNYAPAYSGLADCYVIGMEYGYLPHEAFPRANQAAVKALELDDTLAEAHTSLAAIASGFDWDWVAAEKELKRAIELNPAYVTAHHWYAADLTLTGRHEEAIREMRRARELDPLSLIINENLGEMFYFAGKSDEAIEQLRKTLEMDPDFWLTHTSLGEVYLHKGLHKEAIAELQTASDLSQGHPRVKATLAYAYAIAGKRTEALKVREELETLSKKRHVSPVDMAVIYSALNEKDKAFQLLEEAEKGRDLRLLYTKVDPKFDPLRDDPRFQSLLRRLNFPE